MRSISYGGGLHVFLHGGKPVNTVRVRQIPWHHSDPSSWTNVVGTMILFSRFVVYVVCQLEKYNATKTKSKFYNILIFTCISVIFCYKTQNMKTFYFQFPSAYLFQPTLHLVKLICEEKSAKLIKLRAKNWIMSSCLNFS